MQRPASYYQRIGRPVTATATSTPITTTGLVKPLLDTKPAKQRRYYKSSLIPHAMSTTERLEMDKMKKASDSGARSLRQVPRSPSVVVQSSTVSAKSSIVTAGISAKSSPYFLRRRSISNMQTLLLPSAPTAIVSSNAVISSYSPDHSSFITDLQQPTSSAPTTYSRRTSSIVSVRLRHSYGFAGLVTVQVMFFCWRWGTACFY